MEEVTAEISGPVLAAFHHKFGESQSDFLAILLGCVSVHNYSENSDLATQTEKSKVRVVVQDWVIVSMEKVIDFKTGNLNKESLQSLVKGKCDFKFVGMLRFKKSSAVDLNFLDRRMMTAVLDSCSWSDPRPHLYILVGEEVTSTLSIKVNMTTFLLEHNKNCLQGPWRCRIPLVVPNLGTDQRVEYMLGGGGGSKALREMVEGTGLENAFSMDVDKHFQPLNDKFKASMELTIDRVTELEVTRAVLEKEVMMLKEKRNGRLEITRQMKVIRGMQGDLITALEIIWDDVLEKNSDNDSPDMFAEITNTNGDRETEADEVEGVLDQTY